MKYLVAGVGVYLLYRMFRESGTSGFGATTNIDAAIAAMGPLTPEQEQALRERMRRDPLTAEYARAHGVKPAPRAAASPAPPSLSFPIPQLAPGQFSIDGVPQPTRIEQLLQQETDKVTGQSASDRFRATIAPTPSFDWSGSSPESIQRVISFYESQGSEVRPELRKALNQALSKASAQAAVPSKSYADLAKEVVRYEQDNFGKDSPELIALRAERDAAFQFERASEAQKKQAAFAPEATASTSTLDLLKLTGGGGAQTDEKKKLAREEGPSFWSTVVKGTSQIFSEAMKSPKKPEVSLIPVRDTAEALSLEAQQRETAVAQTTAAKKFYGGGGVPSRSYEVDTGKDPAKVSAAARAFGGETPRAAGTRLASKAVPASQLDFSVGMEDERAVSAAYQFAADAASKARQIAEKYKAPILPVDSQGNLTPEGKTILALENATNDDRAKYSDAVARKTRAAKKSKQLTAQQEQIMLDKEKNKSNSDALRRLEADAREIRKQLDVSDKELSKFKQVTDAYEGSAQKAYSLFEKAEMEKATSMNTAEAMTRAGSSEAERIKAAWAAQNAAQAEAAKTLREAKRVDVTDPTKSFEDLAKGMARGASGAVDAEAQRMDAERSRMAQQMSQQKAASAAALPGTLAAQVAAAQQMAAAAMATQVSQALSMGPAPVKVSRGFVLTGKKTSGKGDDGGVTSSGGGDSGYVYDSGKSSSPSPSSGDTAAASSPWGAAPKAAPTVKSTSKTYAALAGLFFLETV